MSCFAILVLVASSAGAFASNDASDWRPLSLVGLLLVLAVGSDAVSVEVRGLRLSGAFLALVLAMALLGPAPAAALGAASSLIDGFVSRRSWTRALGNTAVFMLFPLLGGLAFKYALGPDPQAADSFAFASVVLLVFLATNVLNFVLVAGPTALVYRVPVLDLLRSFGTALPTEFATALLTAGIAFTYTETGIGAVGLA